MSNPTNIRLWIDDLRSGKYEQGREALITKDGHCCLGVACRTASENGVPLTFVSSDVGSHMVFDGEDVVDLDYDDANYSYLPTSVAVWLGLQENNMNPYVTLKYDVTPFLAGQQVALSQLNDVNVQFDVIAQIIEDHLL